MSITRIYRTSTNGLDNMTKGFRSYDIDTVDKTLARCFDDHQVFEIPLREYSGYTYDPEYIKVYVEDSYEGRAYFRRLVELLGRGPEGIVYVLEASSEFNPTVGVFKSLKGAIARRKELEAQPTLGGEEVWFGIEIVELSE